MPADTIRAMVSVGPPAANGTIIVIGRDGKIIPAQILNVSEGGLALRLLDQAHLHGPVTIRFIIPGSKKTVITAMAAACWVYPPNFRTEILWHG